MQLHCFGDGGALSYVLVSHNLPVALRTREQSRLIYLYTDTAIGPLII